MLKPQTLTFLTQLKKNNQKTWFDVHREEYEAAKANFSNFIQLVINSFQKKDTTIEGIQAKDCLFRINRDIRFSKNKDPYKTNFGAAIKRDGRKSVFAGYYFHCEPGNSFIGGGLWMPDAQSLKNVRQEIDYCWAEFQSLLKEKKFKKVYGDLYKASDISLSTVPKGYEKDNPAADYIKLKCFIAETKLSNEDLVKNNLAAKTIEAFHALQPLLNFINRTLE